MLVLIALLMTVFVATAAFTVDIAYMQLVRTQLRTATDAATKAGAEALGRTQDTGQARQAALDVAAANIVAGQPLILRSDDVEFGNSFLMPDGQWGFASLADPINSIRVNGRRTADSASGSVPFFIAPAIGIDDFEPVQVATAVRIERDICLVVDRSSSMKFAVDSTEQVMWDTDPRACLPPPAESRWIALAEAVDAFLAILDGTPQSERVGLVSYGGLTDWCGILNTDCDIDQALTPDTTQISAAIQAISDTAFNGMTAIGTGIDTSAQVLTDRDTSRPLALKTSIVLTDGVTSAGGSPITAAQNARQNGIVVHTITFSIGADQPQMQQVAAAGGGKHYHAPDAATLVQVFEEIANSLQVVLTQ